MPISDLPGEAWSAASALGAAVVGAVSAVVLERVRAKKRMDELGEQIEEVRRLSQPTGNGFAEHVTHQLGTVLATIEDVSRQVSILDTRFYEHIRTHHDHDGVDRRRWWCR